MLQLLIIEKKYNEDKYEAKVAKEKTHTGEWSIA